MRAPASSSRPDPGDSEDEVGQLAAAFNSVNATTVQVAQEQAALRGSIAEMFVNVARRDQVLLNRQLSFIDSLERAEEDPSTLANLFRLDHLATRMRRNAESLLVLAGIDSGRRLRDAMPLSDVDPHGLLGDRAVRPRRARPAGRPAHARLQRPGRRAHARRAPRERDDLLRAGDARHGHHRCLGPVRASSASSTTAWA